MSPLLPGRELDALVAEKVMGLEVKSGREMQDPRMSEEQKVDFWTPAKDLPVLYEAWKKIPAYSTDIAAAWEVVEKLRELGWFFDLNLQARYTAEYRRDYLNTTPRVQAKEDAAPHAICLAALKALNVQPEGK